MRDDPPVADLAAEALAPGPAQAIGGLSYAFARERGALVRREGEALVCLHRADAALPTLLEVQRLYGDIAWQQIDDAAFEQRLQTTYRENASMAANVADTDAVDLASLADSAAEVDDLLDNRDDSPVIRLINALLLEAIKEGASDIHIETQERRLIVRFRVDGVLREMIEPKRRWRRCWSAGSR